jgi:predicted ATPase
MRDLPRGTVTFLFTDVEGSTRLLHELGAEAYAAALDEHRSALREAFARHGGVEVDTQGDAFFVAFPTAPGAAAAALDSHAALAPGPIRIRVGLHTGTPHLTDEGYVGVDVHKGARIAAVGHGGQTLLSEATRRLIDGDARDLGLHRLRDLTAAERLFQLGDGDFPPLRSLNQSNLPVPATPFLGRTRELAEVITLARTAEIRLLTLTGPGGTGKTRLALQAAGQLIDENEHGVWWTPLAPIADERQVVPAMARAVGAPAGLAEHVGDRRMLLFFDNFEHVLGAATELADLLARCRNVTVLVTSREPLHLHGEQEYQVAPLAPDEGVDLFVTRARAAGCELEPDETVAAICSRLDGLPLALELAAARTKSLSARQILARLEERLPLLTGGARDLPERQRTLRDTIAWSHELLDGREQQLFARLAVFAGGCTLEAAESVCDAELDTIGSLVDKSLLRRTGERYWMLETIREYAGTRLAACGEGQEQLRRRHAEHFLAVADASGLSIEAIEAGARQRHDVGNAEHANLRSAIDWATGADPELAVRIACALENFWVAVAPAEGVAVFAGLLEHFPALPPALRARANRCYGSGLFFAGDEQAGQAVSLQALSELEALGDTRGMAVVKIRLATSESRLGHREQATALARESLELSRRSGSRISEAIALGVLGHYALAEQRHDDARELLTESLDNAVQAGFTWWQINMSADLAELALSQGRPGDARALAVDVLRLAVSIDDRLDVLLGLALSALVAARDGSTQLAGTLWGVLESEERRGFPGIWEHERRRLGDEILPLADEAFERGRAVGGALELAEALEVALAASAAPV